MPTAVPALLFSPAFMQTWVAIAVLVWQGQPVTSRIFTLLSFYRILTVS
jgi:hypothetical protein